MSAARHQANCDRSVLDEMIAGIWGNGLPRSYTEIHRQELERVSKIRAAKPVPLPVDVTDESAFPNIAEAQRHARKGVK